MKVNIWTLTAAALVMVSLAAVFFINPAGQIGECRPKPGHIFIDCVDPAWQGISSWELRHDTGAESFTTRGDQSDLVQWQIVDGGGDHGKVIDVHYSEVPANGRLRFHVNGSRRVADMSAYASGALEFDLKVLDWGTSERVLSVRVVCVYPCSSEAELIRVPDTDTWHRVHIPIARLIDSGLDITNVDIALAISPTWNRMQGVHFQLDNIRWVAGDDQSSTATNLDSSRR